MNPLPCSSPIIPNSPKGEDLILGYDFLYHFNPIIDWKNGLITYDSSGINSSASNALATAVNGVALSLLKSRDKRCLRRCCYIFTSSLSRGYGPFTLSFHASLEEKWDEKEEPEDIETVLKVVPPAYHQYLDVFSKAKAEKLPPHCACDHHIKLEGLLPQFQTLREAFNTAPILFHFNPSLPTIVETDASDYALGAVLSQVNDSGKRPIEFDSRKLLPAEMNYEILDKELLGIVWALKCWRDFLLSLSNSFEVLTDHSSFQYFMSSKVPTCHQDHWADFLSEFYFTINYHPGRLATLPDAVSHRDDMCPERGVEFISKNPQTFHQIINQEGIQG
ncbi:hypothetical protein O181_047864 [Austropuccinia psidii MF-1]|uniref:Reverse transcriptase RNase H-like domain-containing protein n=1 Tax=Austropuccinia psidii MF-1 TaxID=1389203 RepID=A0A9Q3HMF8_9BASI|nr:hypothetical protein [Austropuccinia psidii MF-1]